MKRHAGPYKALSHSLLWTPRVATNSHAGHQIPLKRPGQPLVLQRSKSACCLRQKAEQSGMTEKAEQLPSSVHHSLLFWLALVFGTLVAGVSHTVPPVHSLWPLPSASASALLDACLSLAWIFSWSEVQPNPATGPFKKQDSEASSCFHLFANGI